MSVFLGAVGIAQVKAIQVSQKKMCYHRNRSFYQVSELPQLQTVSFWNLI